MERLVPTLYLWDLWPVRHPNGAPVHIDDIDLWMALSASADLDPGQRHDVARIRLLGRRAVGWVDLGNVFPEGASLGSREWAGCATYWPESREIEVLYTASGRRGEPAPTFVQRVVSALGHLGEDFAIDSWSEHFEPVAPGSFYVDTSTQRTGEPGFIKAFRDPFRFEDPRTGDAVLLFTASMPNAHTDFNGSIGIARGERVDRLEADAPLITADGVNNELERPHLVYHEDLYYLFFSTQARTFHPDVVGVTGLYGFVSESLDGGWEPLNESGLVLCNPVEEPFQAYSWLVTDDLNVSSFVDFHSLGGRRPEDVESAGAGRDHFGGTLAPLARIELHGNGARLVDSP